MLFNRIWDHGITPSPRINESLLCLLMRVVVSAPGRSLFENSRSQATWPIVRQCFEEHWLAHHGQPESIRVDLEGAWQGEEADAYCRERGISLTPIPAEGCWQIGIVENAIKS